MRRISLLLTLLLPAAALSAPPSTYRNPVEVAVTGFKASVDDGRVVCTWKRYKREDFVSYKVVKSSSKEQPVYPDEPSIYSTEQAGDNRFEDGKLTEGTWHYRLVIITRFGDRWTSAPVTVVIDSAAIKRAAPTAADFE